MVSATVKPKLTVSLLHINNSFTFYNSIMDYSFSFHKKLHIASLSAKNAWHNLSIHTLLQNVNQKQPSINAFLGARYSRSADSVVDIAAEIMDRNTDAAARLEQIFEGYGHKSVGDMANIFVCIENIPAFVAERLFYINPVHAGQQRSTRFQNFENPNFIPLPSKLCKQESLRKRYEALIKKQFNDYADLLEPTGTALQKYFKINTNNKKEKKALQARTFDTARYFLPIGFLSSLGLLMSARSWAELIGYLRSSSLAIERELGELIFTLLVGNKEMKKQGYIPEADGLIRHTESNQTRNTSCKTLLSFLKKKFKNGRKRKILEHMHENLDISYNTDAIHSLLRHYQLLINPLSKEKKFRFTKKELEKVGTCILSNHNHHNQIGNIGQSGSIVIESMADYGSVVRDLLRHRSLERFVPLLEHQIDLDNEFDRDNDQCFFLCDYLEIPELANLRKEYKKRFIKTYEMIKAWYADSKKVLTPEVRTEYTRYLLPQAHATAYRYYGSIDDLQYTISLRTRNGGHIAYRRHTYAWLQKLAKLSPFWNTMVERIPEVDNTSRNQFVDRG